MSIVVNIYYTGTGGNARKFAEEMEAGGIAAKVRGEEGNLRYDYFFPMADPETVLLIDGWKDQKALDRHHASPMMEKIVELRKKYDLDVRVERYAPDLKKLGFGLMRLPLTDKEDPASIDVEQVKRMVDLFMEKGFTYFDTAWMYCGFNSENVAKTALVDRYPRESFTLATKLHAGFFQSPEDRDKVFNQQREKTGVTYFDYYLLHGISRGSYGKYEQFDCFQWLKEKKAQGLVKHIGFSFHDDAQLLDQILTEHPEMEFVQLQINYLDWESPWIQSRECYETAVRHGVPVIVMEPVKGGTLARVPEKAEKLLKEYTPHRSVSSWAMRFAASLSNVMMVLSGMSDEEQVRDNVSTMEVFQPLQETEKELLSQVTAIIQSATAVPCTGCAYCVDGCPKKIAIPKVFSLYNEEMREAKEKNWTPSQNFYDQLVRESGRAGDCIGCGQCEKICPQHLPVIRHLKEVSGHYDN